MKKLDSESTSQEEFASPQLAEWCDTYPVQMFLRWFNQRPIEHQLELSEFIGHFCYEELSLTCETDGAKIFACREYLKLCVGNLEREEKLLRLIDDIIRFIVEVNEIADSGLFDCEEVIYELRDIISLYSMMSDLPQRSNKWLMTYHDWLAFRKNFSFFSLMEPFPEYERLITELTGNLRRHL